MIFVHKALSELVTDAQLRGVLQKIKQHIYVLEKSSARVSSRAEVYGAVQQVRELNFPMSKNLLFFLLYYVIAGLIMNIKFCSSNIQ